MSNGQQLMLPPRRPGKRKVKRKQADMETELLWTSLRRRQFGPVSIRKSTLRQLVKQRRSALSLDGITSISAETFYGMLDRLLPRAGVPPWDVWPWPPHLHCGIFVHRVRGLPSGLYLFERSPTVHARLRSALHADFLWKRPEGCPEYLPLYELAEGDFREQAQVVSCHQEIAGDGAFSLGMIAEFGESIRATGAWWYRRLFWEAGLLGQVLYLEAEAAGVRGTGIGCYFDDAFHSLLGLDGDCFQSLYHFTVRRSSRRPAADDPAGVFPLKQRTDLKRQPRGPFAAPTPSFLSANSIWGAHVRQLIPPG